MPKIFFISSNKHKFEEASVVIPNLVHLSLELPEVQSLDPKVIILAKINAAIKLKKGNIIVEDTGLYLDCLNGLPGPLVKLFLEKVGPSGIYDIAKKYENFSAKAVTVVGYFDGRKIHFTSGEVSGKVVLPFGERFGWDPIFVPNGSSKRFSEMSIDEKNKFSMRKKALIKIKKLIG